MTPAAKVWAFIIGGALAYDVLALKADLETLSACSRRHPVVTLVLGGYLMAHLLGHPAVLHRYDPLHVAAGLIQRPVADCRVS